MIGPFPDHTESPGPGEVCVCEACAAKRGGIDPGGSTAPPMWGTWLKDRARSQLDDHVRPEVQALVRRGNVTAAEVAEMRCNSWEWEALTLAMDDEAFVTRQCLGTRGTRTIKFCLLREGHTGKHSDDHREWGSEAETEVGRMFAATFRAAGTR